jgi:hypothetical protein
MTRKPLARAASPVRWFPHVGGQFGAPGEFVSRDEEPPT